MTTRAADATFEVGTFVWANGAFELTGAWQDADDPERVRLLVEIEGREKNIAGRVNREGPGWSVRFLSSKRPDDGAAAALVVAGHQIELPSPGISDAPPPPPPPSEPPAASSTDGDVRGAEALLQQLRSERQALEQARQQLASERRAAEQLEQRLKTINERPLPPRRARLQLPKQAQLRSEEEPDYTPVYWVCSAVAFMFLLVLIWIL